MDRYKTQITVIFSKKGMYETMEGLDEVAFGPQDDAAAKAGTLPKTSGTLFKAKLVGST